jgi:MYXO-CTERM domain-containing protein
VKIQKNLKFGVLTVAMLAACGGASALDLKVSQIYTTTALYNFQPGQELISFALEEDNKFAVFQSSSLNLKVINFSAGGKMTDAPPKTERQTLFAEINVIANPAPNVFRAQLGQVTLYPSSGEELLSKSIGSQVHLQFSEKDLAASSRVVVSDGSTAQIGPEYGYGPRYPAAVSQVRGSRRGGLVLRSEYTVVYRADNSFDKFLGWLDNVEAFDTLSFVKKTIRERAIEKLQHATADELKFLFKTNDASLGVRGEVTFEGMTVHTASPGVLAYTATLPDALTIDVPLAFTKNNVGAVLDVAFDGQTLASFRGDDYLTDEINLLNIDISSFAGRTGELTFTVNTTGPGSAEIFVAERLGGMKVNATVLTPVPEAGTYAMMLAGLGALAGLVSYRRRRSILR